jgi:uncharacterized damage-inducible protein DinB
MLKEPNWTERIFDFNFPAEYFPYVVERVRGTPARLEELVRDIKPKLLTVRPENGPEWSIQEHVGHLYDLEEIHLGRLDDFAGGKEVLRAADMNNRKTYEADHNSASLPGLLKAFRASRKQFVERIENRSEQEVGQSALHPRLRVPMRLVDLVFFTAEHDDHHLACISLIAREGRRA